MDDSETDYSKMYYSKTDYSKMYYSETDYSETDPDSTAKRTIQWLQCI